MGTVNARSGSPGSPTAGASRHDLLHDPRWADGRVETSAASRPALAWAAAFIWNVLAVALLVGVFPELWAEGSLLAWAIVVFALPGAHLLWRALVVTARWRRFGTVTLHLDPFPGSLGGHVGGRLLLPVGRRAMARATSRSRFRVTLSCIRTGTRARSSGSDAEWQEVVWTDEVEPEVARRGRDLEVRFAVEVPEGLPATDGAPTSPTGDGGLTGSSGSSRPTGSRRPDGAHRWAVRVVGEMPGADFDQSFEVPVLDTGEPRLASGSETSPPAGGALRRDELPRRMVRISSDGRGLRFEYPVGRDLYAGLMLSVFGAIFAGCGVFLATQVAADFASPDLFGLAFGGIAGVMALLFGGLGLLLLLLGLYTLTNRLDVRIGAGDVTARRRLLGIPVSSRSVPTDSLTEIRMKVTGQTGQGAQAKVRYSIVGIVDGVGVGDERQRRITLGDGLRGPGVADAVAGRIAEATGVPVERVGR